MCSAWHGWTKSPWHQSQESVDSHRQDGHLVYNEDSCVTFQNTWDQVPASAFQFQFPANVCCGRQQVLPQVFESLLSMWETWIEFLAVGFA